MTARNFNPPIATAAKICIAEVEEIVEPGQLKPDEIHLSGIYVKRIIKGPKFVKRIERLTVSKKNGSSAAVNSKKSAAEDEIRGNLLKRERERERKIFSTKNDEKKK